MENNRFFSRLTLHKEQALVQAVSILKKWLDELLIEGISSLQNDSDKIIEISTRMVDFGMPGIARKLRLIPDKIKDTVDFTEFVLYQLGEFYLFIQSFHSLHKLDQLEREDLLNYAGVVFKKTDFEDDHMLPDEWLYLGCQKEKEEKLLIKRNWFYGIHSTKKILLLEFQFNKFVKLKPINCGYIYRSAVRFFPSKVPQRIKDISTDQIVKADISQMIKVNLKQLLDQYCQDLRLNPFIRHQCYLLHEVKISKHADRWFFTNDENQLVEIINEKKDIPKILGFSGNKKSVYACEYYHNALTILSIIIDDLVLEV